jgi:hypothetical protein
MAGLSLSVGIFPPAFLNHPASTTVHFSRDISCESRAEAIATVVGESRQEPEARQAVQTEEQENCEAMDHNERHDCVFVALEDAASTRDTQ